MFHGSIPALITPFKNGTIDRDAFANLIEFQIEGGSGALVPCGTTGESATLSHAEHKQVVELCIEVAAGRIPVIAGAGSNSTTMPVILYNVPSRTACDLLPETASALAKLPNVIGIKDASNDLGRVSIHAALTEGEQFVQISGEDPSSLGHRAMGGAGCISVTANVAPQLCAAMHKAFDEGDLKKAQAIDKRLIQLHKAMFLSPSPGPAKYLLSKVGICSDEVRLPIVKPDAETCEAIDAAYAAAQLT